MPLGSSLCPNRQARQFSFLHRHPCFWPHFPFPSHMAQTTLGQRALYTPVPDTSLTATDRSRSGWRSLLTGHSLQLVTLNLKMMLAGDWSCKCPTDVGEGLTALSSWLHPLQHLLVSYLLPQNERIKRTKPWDCLLLPLHPLQVT